MLLWDMVSDVSEIPAVVTPIGGKEPHGSSECSGQGIARHLLYSNLFCITYKEPTPLTTYHPAGFTCPPTVNCMQFPHLHWG